jgi:hypothetical protein
MRLATIAVCLFVIMVAAVDIQSDIRIIARKCVAAQP